MRLAKVLLGGHHLRRADPEVTMRALARSAAILLSVAACAGAPGRDGESAEPALELVREHGWKPRGAAQETAYEVPQPGGLPFVNLQSASSDIGLDLTPVAGRTLRQKKFVVGKTRSGYTLFAFVVLDGKRPVGAWIGTDGPAAPGIWSLDTSESELSD